MKKTFLLITIFISLISWSSAQNGLNFDGDDDFVQTDYFGVLDSDNRTFEAWIFIPSSAPSAALAILDYGFNSGGSRNTFLVGSNRELRYISGGTFANLGTPDSVILADKWTHVAFVLEDGTGYLYVDGVELVTGSLSSVDTPDNQAVKIGQRVNGGNIPFYGIIDEVRIWDIARTPAEIEATKFTEFCIAPPNLTLYLPFNQGVAAGDNMMETLAIDESANGNNGVLNNFDLTGDTSNWVFGFGLLNGSTFTTDTQTACDSYTWIDGNTYTENNNTANIMLTATTGCDSIVTLDLTINTVNTAVSQDGPTLTATEDGATYQWLTCPAMTPINGATNQSYTATVSGDYAVVVTNNFCADTSICNSVSVVGTIQNEFGNALQLFPNPTIGKFSIDLGEVYPSTIITITDLNGKQILSNIYNNEQVFNLAIDEPSGVYLLLIEANDKKAVFRLVKQ